MYWLILGIVAVGAIALGAKKASAAAPNAPPLPYQIGWIVRVPTVYDATQTPAAQSAVAQAGPNTFWGVKVTALPGSGNLAGLYMLSSAGKYVLQPQMGGAVPTPVTFNAGDVVASSPTG